MEILKNLKPYWKSVIVIVFLLIIQAYCDLALPDYTSRLIDTGIQNYGIENCSPVQIDAKAYEVIGGFMDEDSRVMWNDCYELQSDGLYHLNETGNEKLDILDKIVAEPLMMYYYPYSMAASEEDNDLKDMLSAGGMTLDDMDYDMWMVMGEKIRPTIAVMRESMGDEMILSSAISCTVSCYDSTGYDYQSGQMRYLIKSGIFMIVVTLFMVACGILTGYVAAKVAAGVGCTLRENVFKKVISFSDAEINRFSTASLITRSTNDVQQVQMVTVMLLRMVLYAPVLAVGGVIKVANTGAGMGWIIFVAIAAIFALLGTLLIIAMSKFKILQTLVDKVNLVSREILTGIPVIRAFGREKQEEKRFDDANKELTKTNLFVNRVMTFMMPLLMLIMYGTTLLIEWVAAHRIESGNLQVGTMTAFITYTMLIIMSFLMIGMMSIMLPRANVAANRIKEVLETDNTIIEKKDAKVLDAVKGIVQFHHVSFTYPDGDGAILQDIDFTALPGQTTAIVGGTGCGKSSLVQLLPRFYDVTEGSITIDGTDIRELTMESLRKSIGYVPQKSVLFSGTIASNIKFGAEDASEEQMKLAADIAQAADFIEEKEEQYDSPIAQGGSNVSGGQKQRLAIARAIAKNPKIYIFDDSFSALDFKTDAAVRKALGEKVKDSTVFIVAQRVSTIMHAEQILVIDEGRLVGKGTHKELMENCPVYQQIAKSQLSEKELTASVGKAVVI